jgi:alpha-amylase
VSKPVITLYFHVHQPSRLKRYSVFRRRDRGEPLKDAYLDSELDRHYFSKIAKQCYLPANKILLESIE